MCQPRVDRSVGSPSLEDSDIRIEKKWNWKEKRQEEPDFSQSGFQFALCEWLVSTKGSGAAKRKSYRFFVTFGAVKYANRLYLWSQPAYLRE